jgi:hypothetical protein
MGLPPTGRAKGDGVSRPEANLHIGNRGAQLDRVPNRMALAPTGEWLEPIVGALFGSLDTISAELEIPPEGSKRKSISLLIADGKELLARFSPSIRLKKGVRSDSLRAVIQPWLQLVPGDRDEPVRDEFTNIPLGEIWRYFRFFWSIPQTAIPGRQMFYLVRDRAHPCHAVIGIACLGNSPLMSPQRDDAIGWTPERLRKRLEGAALANDVSRGTPARFRWPHPVPEVLPRARRRKPQGQPVRDLFCPTAERGSADVHKGEID